LEALRQTEQAAQKAIDPDLRQVFGQSQGEKACQGFSTHGRNVAQATRQAAVADGGRWMPGAAEVHVLQTKVGGHQQFGAGGGPQNGAIIPDSTHYRPGGRAEGELPNMPDQISLCEHQLFHNYIKNNDLLIHHGRELTMPPSWAKPEGNGPYSIFRAII
jgi:hypothetical protein